MKRIALVLIVALCFLPATGQAGEGFRADLIAGIGLPRGFLDITANTILSARKGVLPGLYAQLSLHSSFGTKQDSKFGGRLSLWANSAYFLARLDLPSPGRRISPYLAGGGGIHLLYSIASSSSAIGKEKKTLWTTKSHGIFGFDVPFNTKVYLSVWARMTYPSNELLDVVYVTSGYRFW